MLYKDFFYEEILHLHPLPHAAGYQDPINSSHSLTSCWTNPSKSHSTTSKFPHDKNTQCPESNTNLQNLNLLWHQIPQKLFAVTQKQRFQNLLISKIHNSPMQQPPNTLETAINKSNLNKKDSHQPLDEVKTIRHRNHKIHSYHFRNNKNRITNKNHYLNLVFTYE